MKSVVFVLCVFFGNFAHFAIGQPNLYDINRQSRLVANVNRTVCPSVTLKNGLAKRRGARGRMLRYFCNRGYLLAGERHSTCFRNKWDPPPPRCVRPTCKPLVKQPNTNELIIWPTHSGAAQHFFCGAGFTLNGPRDIFCDGVKWSDSAPTCLVSNTKPFLSCDFESPDLCGWTHDLNHDFDWIRESYNTPSGSIGTGPSFDHTKGVGFGGHYMYIESSSRAENDTARLISPVYELIDTEICLEFYYHMFGATIGSLKVYLKMVNESWELDPEKALFSKSGNQGDKWYRSYHHIGFIPNEFQIVIEGVRGAGYVSDIAIDDVSIIPNCTESDSTSTTPESSTYNEIIPTIDSCDKRCGQVELLTKDNYHLTCDCDNDCFNLNRCCPDFYDTCADTDDQDSAMTDDTESTTSKHTSQITFATEIAIKPTEFSTKTEPKVVSTPKIFPVRKPSTKIPITSTTVLKSTAPTTPRSTSTTTRITTFRAPTTSSKRTPVPTKPVIIIQTPPQTPTIFRKVITSTPKPTSVFYHRTTARYKQIDDDLNLPNGKVDAPNTINDEVDVPRPTDADEGIYESVGGGAKEFWSDEIENSLDHPYHGNFSEINKLFSQSYIEKANSNFLILGISIAVVFIVLSAALVYTIRRYRFSRGMMSSNGESQSDVRYLTEGDMLDFSLADCYDE